MRRLPKFVRIGGLKHIITRAPDLTYDHDGHADPAHGLYIPTAPAIVLDEGDGSERAKVTLVHEVLHAIVNTARLEVEDEDEEKIVGRVAPILLDFIRSNRGAIAYLQES